MSASMNTTKFNETIRGWIEKEHQRTMAIVAEQLRAKDERLAYALQTVASKLDSAHL